MKWRHYLLLFLPIAVIALFAHHCGKPKEYDPVKKPQEIPKELRLKADEQTRVVYDAEEQTVTVATKTEVRTVVGVRHATVIVKKSGEVLVQARSYGLCLEPGIGLVYGDHLGLAIDVQVAYWQNSGLLLGARAYPYPSPYVAFSYSLARIRLSSTSVFVGLGLGREILGGVRLRF